MALEKRMGQIEIGGKTYPLNYSIRNADEIDKALAANPPEEYGAYGNVVKNVRVLAILIRDGVEYMKRFHGEEVEPLAEDDILSILDPGDNPRIIAAIKETIESGSVRLISVQEKNAQAAPAGRKKG